MILATDTHYADSMARTAGVMFREWTDETPMSTYLVESDEFAAYEPGAFYRRELPLILALLDVLPTTPSILLIDGYVQLDAKGRPGLGAHLFDALDGKRTVVGVAKSPFHGSPHAIPVHRGRSKRPLYVTAAGVAHREAAGWVRSMSGEHRHPELLRLVDRLCREGRA